jgi:hypothetical protein
MLSSSRADEERLHGLSDRSGDAPTDALSARPSLGWMARATGRDNGCAGASAGFALTIGFAAATGTGSVAPAAAVAGRATAMARPAAATAAAALSP